MPWVPKMKPPSEQVLAGTRILTLDDDPNMRSIVRSILQQCGCPEILQAGFARDALKLIAVRPIDLVICDWMMEPMNGFQFLSELRRFDRGAKVPAIMLTGNSEPIDAIASQHLNIGAWLVKPVATTKLIERISAVLSLPTRLFSIEEDLQIDLSQFAHQYRAKLSAEIGDLERYVKEFARHNRNEIVSRWSSLVRLFHAIKGQAGTFDYHLITVLAAVGQDLLREAEGNVEVLIKFQAALQRTLAVLVTAMNLVLQNDIKGKGGAVGDRLITKINEATLPTRQLIEAELKYARRA
jgi:two-component system, chemotaxis family, chemotaxis protein CheY